VLAIRQAKAARSGHYALVVTTFVELTAASTPSGLTGRVA
jgi:hypothetical protein